MHQKKARERRAVVVFEDEVSFQQEGTTRRSWAKVGVGFTVYHHPCKRRSKFFGAISLEQKPQLTFQKAETFNGSSFRRFLEHLLTVHKRVCLIIDNVRYHISKKIQAFLRQNKHRLWIYKLPKYSPELNAVEMVWRETRKDATHNQYFATPKRLTRTVQTQFRTYQREPHRLVGPVAQFLRA